ncbi:MAG: recombinase family protein [Nitrospira sp.]|nr:recombinase family protein [Nitrospira sp.]
MNVALYARFSSENQREQSITDQFRACEDYVVRHSDWVITHRYKDEAISGTHDARGRAGYRLMLDDAKARAFDALVVFDLSRLSRDSVETEQTRRRLVHWGIRLIAIGDGVDSQNEGHELMSGFKGLMNQQFLKDLARHVRRGMAGQVLKGYHGGGRTYGYRLVPEYHPTEKDPYGQPQRIGSRLEIDPEQARVVQRIFQEFVEGVSPVKIVERLNAEGVPPPGVAFRRRSMLKPTWCASALYGNPRFGLGLLNCHTYKGELIWGKSKWPKDPDTKRKRRLLCDESEWIRTPAEHLRIIDDTLWGRVKERQASINQASAAIRTALHANARTGRRPKYLFSGLLTCGMCGRKFIVISPTEYACSGWKYRGLSVCQNTIKVSRQVVESRLLSAIQHDLFTEEGFAIVKQEVARLLAERRRQTPDISQAKARLTKVEQEITNLVEAVKLGVVTSSTKAELVKLEAEQQRLQDTLKRTQSKADQVTAFLPDVIRRFKAAVENLATVTQHSVDKTRGILRDLMGAQIVLHPTADGSTRYLTAEVSGDYAGLYRLVTGKNKFGGGEGS